MSRPTVALAFALADGAAAAYLAERADVVVADPIVGNWVDLVAAADAVIVRPPARLDVALLACAPRLRVIANIGSGVDHIDLAAAAERDIAVLSQPGANAHAVAEYVLGALITASRRLDAAVAFMRIDGADWTSRIGALRGHELTGATLGIVGYGAVGRALAPMARAGLGMRVIVFDPYASPAAGEVDAVCGSLSELLTDARAVSVHVPLTAETRGLIGAAELAQLGPGTILVNTSRGGVVDEDAVISSLRAGQLGGAALDVFETEPPPRSRLVEFATVPGLIVTPHIAGITYEAGAALAWAAVRGVLSTLAAAKVLGE
jgi:(S)-sulfolactate dehydrogenase